MDNAERRQPSGRTDRFPEPDSRLSTTERMTLGGIGAEIGEAPGQLFGPLRYPLDLETKTSLSQ